MASTLRKRGAAMDLGRLRARLATALMKIKSTQSGKVDVLNIEVGGKMVKLLCTPYRVPQGPLEFLELIERDMLLLNVNPVNGADCVTPVIMASLINNPETILAIYR